MTGSEFKSMVNYYGEDNILGIAFDNSAAVTFGKGEFKLANNYVEEIESLQFVGFHAHGIPFHVVKHIENVQGIIVRDKNYAFELYDRITIRP
jgi:hypothetical protein